ncbi:MAG TPA: UTRA domain-containing protein, partial [Casimicrobiaceae bacterium]|nr:UTRA domain-containing protein [Casimicrobiaceae bacterium]
GLGVPVGETVTYLKRLRLADRAPVALDHRYIPADLMKGIELPHFREEALWRLLSKHKGVNVKEAIFTIKAAGATQDTADALQVPLGSPVLHHESQVFDVNGRVVILGSTLYHPDRFVYQTSVQAARIQS